MPTGLATTNSTNKYPNVKQLSWANNYPPPHPHTLGRIRTENVTFHQTSQFFKAKNRFLRQHLGGPLIPNPQLSQLAVEGHVPSNLVSQFQQLRKGFFWDTLYITTMCNMPATEKHNPQHTFTCSQHRRLLGVQRSNVVRFMSLCFALAIGIHKAALAQGHYI